MTDQVFGVATIAFACSIVLLSVVILRFPGQSARRHTYSTSDGGKAPTSVTLQPRSIVVLAALATIFCRSIDEDQGIREKYLKAKDGAFLHQELLEALKRHQLTGRIVSMSEHRCQTLDKLVRAIQGNADLQGMLAGLCSKYSFHQLVNDHTREDEFFGKLLQKFPTGLGPAGLKELYGRLPPRTQVQLPKPEHDAVGFWAGLVWKAAYTDKKGDFRLQLLNDIDEITDHIFFA